MKIQHKIFIKSLGFGTIATSIAFAPAYAVTQAELDTVLRTYCIPPDGSNCHPNKIAKWNGSGCTCVDGAIWLPSTRECLKCESGTYLKNSTDTFCTKCPAGYKCLGGATQPVKCPAGTYNTTEGNSSCYSCDKGHYCTGGTNRTACSTGTYNSNTGASSSSSCVSCSEATYGSWSASCGEATRSKTTYCTNYGSTFATANASTTTESGNAGECTCPAGFGTNGTVGSNLFGDNFIFIYCDGSFTNGGFNLDPSDPDDYFSISYYCNGQFVYKSKFFGPTPVQTNNRFVADNCKKCDSNSYNDGTKSTCTYELCGAGKYMKAEEGCKICPVGYYCQCPDGNLKCKENATSPSECHTKKSEVKHRFNFVLTGGGCSDVDYYYEYCTKEGAKYNEDESAATEVIVNKRSAKCNPSINIHL